MSLLKLCPCSLSLTYHEAFPQERSKPSQPRNSGQQMRHLENRVENRGFGQTNNNFNPAFDPFEDDYFNR